MQPSQRPFWNRNIPRVQLFSSKLKKETQEPFLQNNLEEPAVKRTSFLWLFLFISMTLWRPMVFLFQPSQIFLDASTAKIKIKTKKRSAYLATFFSRKKIICYKSLNTEISWEHWNWNIHCFTQTRTFFSFSWIAAEKRFNISSRWFLSASSSGGSGSSG